MTITNSLNSLQASEKIAVRPVEDKPQFALQEQGRSSGPPSPEQKVMRERSQDNVSI